MSTSAQIAANQANAQLSSGPATPEGLARSSRNNLRHGFRSQTVLLPGEDPAEYEALLAELTESFITSDHLDEIVELRFIREMADAEWRLRRVRACIEDALTRRIAALAPLHPDASPTTLHTLAIETLAEATGASYATWLRYESKFERQYERAYKGWRDFHNDVRRAQALAADTQMKRVFFRPTPDEPGYPAPELASNVQPPPDAPQTPRNAPCPCGSGDKFKRCCGKNAPPVLQQAA